MCLLWPLWHNAFPEAQWIIVRRDPMDIVNSCMRTGFMRGYGTPVGWRYWVMEHEKRFSEMKDAGLDVREVWPQKMINGEFSEMESVVKELGLEWDEKKAVEFICPDLWKGGKR